MEKMNSNVNIIFLCLTRSKGNDFWETSPNLIEFNNKENANKGMKLCKVLLVS
jgi:hypothetical protein